MFTQGNTKLRDFSNNNSIDFIRIPIAPPATSAESYDVKAALLNLIMKDQFEILMKMVHPILILLSNYVICKK